MDRVIPGTGIKYLTPRQREERAAANRLRREQGLPTPSSVPGGNKPGPYAPLTLSPTEVKDYGKHVVTLIKNTPVYSGIGLPTEKQLDAVWEIVAFGNFGHHAASAIGIPEATWKTWMQKGRQGTDPYVVMWNRYQTARAAAITVLVARAKQASDAGVWQATYRMLESFAAEDWQKTERIQSDIGDVFKTMLTEIAELRKGKQDALAIETTGRVEALPPGDTA